MSLPSLILERGGWPGGASAYGYDHDVPGRYRAPSYTGRYGGMDPTPAPAPAPRPGSIEPAQYGYPSTSGRRTLTRQHRSMDTVIPPGTLTTYDIPFTEDVPPPHEPLNISTNFPSSYNYRTHLSNPTPSNQAFWSRTESMLPYADTGGGGGRMTMGMSAEYEQLKVDYQAAIEKLNQTMNSIKTFWSPELKRERQLRREEATRISQLERLLASGGSGSGDTSQLRMEIAARDDRIRQLTAMLDDTGLRGMPGNYSEIRIRELQETIVQLQEMLKAKDQHTMSQLDSSSRFAVENALRRVDEKEARIHELEDELCRIRMHSSSQQPRDFTDKSISNHDMITLRMKLERSEVELSERKVELANCQTRMRSAEEQATDLRAHVQVLKEQITNREQQCSLLQGDVEALRQKLEAKNDTMTQREARIERLEKELAGVRGDVQDKSEQQRQGEMRISQLVGRVENLETSLREKEQELDRAKVRLLSHPDIIKEKELREKIEQGELEKQRLQEHIDQLRRSAEQDRLEQQETYKAELRQLRSTVENLQKELQDRDVLLESQNEKIGDLSREVAGANQRIQDAMVDKGTDELRKEVEGARNEVDKLLKMVRQLEKENGQLTTQCKQLQGTIDRHVADPHATGLGKMDRGPLSSTTSTSAGAPGNIASMKKRIEELEEALRESVSITAEREMVLSQQKHNLQQMNAQLIDARRELSETRKATPSAVDKDQILRTMENERRQHLEQLFQLKQEALLAAISEKDTHLAYLEKMRAPREEIETIRRHKEGLMRKLKQENERRAMVMNRPESAASMVGPATVGVGAPITALSAQPSPRADLMTTSGDQDDSEGIWA